MEMDNDGNIERLLTGWKYCNLYYFFTLDLLIGMFLSHFRTKGFNNVFTMFTKLWFKHILIFWCKMDLS